MLLIDEILAALGWPKDAFNPETRTQDGGFIDYLLTQEASGRLVVEAKRLGHTFSLPKSGLRRFEYQLSYMRSAFGAPLTEVLEQAERYCRETNVSFAVLTNGAEWILVQTIPPPGVRDGDQKCYYFGNLLDASSNFQLLWELISHSAVAQNHLEEAFSHLNAYDVEYCVEPRGVAGDLAWCEVSEDQDLLDFYSRFFDEITDEGRRKMLEKCYVTSRKLAQYQGELKRALTDIAPAYMTNAEELTDNSAGRILYEPTGDQKGHVVLIVGSVGAGKSTFVEKTLVENRGLPNLSFLRLDLVDEGLLYENGAPQRLWDLVLQEWNQVRPKSKDHKFLTQVFHSELEQLRKGPSARVFALDENKYVEAEARELESLCADPERFLPRVWRHLESRRGEKVVIFLDNVDRASEAFQKRVYAFGHAVAKTSGATVLVTMREATYFSAKESGFLDVRSSDKVFHLQAPDVVQLVSKRVQYVENHMLDDHRAKKWRRSDHWNEFQTAASAYAVELKETFLKTAEGQSALALLATLAWHNIRAFLRTLKDLHSKLRGGEIPWPRQRMIFALATCGTTSGLRGLSATLYRPPSIQHSCFLLKIRLTLLLRVGVRQADARRGLSVPRLIEFCRYYGYRRRWVERALEELVRDRMLECLDIPSAVDYSSAYELELTHRFRLSPFGILALDEVQFDPAYLVCAGWNMPYHKKRNLDMFLDSVRLVLGDELVPQIEPASADLLAEHDTPSVVAFTLREARLIEQPASPYAASCSEVVAVEERLEAVFARFERTFPGQSCDAANAPPSPTSLPQQLALNTDIPSRDRVVLIGVPPLLPDARIGGSTTGPLILWALVFAHVNKALPASGAEVTRIINEHLRDDFEKLEPTNVSRALRSPTLRSASWLRTVGERRRWRYALGPAWRDAWRTLFSVDPPC